MVHQLIKLERDVEKTHPGAGRLAAFSLVTCKAKKTLLVIAPAGCGKSATSDLMMDKVPGAIKVSTMTAAGLTPWQDSLSNFNGLVVMDDLGRLQTTYRRLNTLATLTELVYSHYAEDHTGHQHLSINHFNASAILNCQPVVLREAMRSGDWEATVADKTLRYYHLFRPVKPTLDSIRADVGLGIEVKDVSLHVKEPVSIRNLIKLGYAQWGMARSREHITDLLKATAALDESEIVRALDVRTLARLMKPLWLERHVVDKKSLEGERRLRSDLLYFLTEFVTYGEITFEVMMRNYKVSESTLRRVMERYARLWVITNKNPTRYGPSPEMKALMKEVN